MVLALSVVFVMLIALLVEFPLLVTLCNVLVFQIVTTPVDVFTAVSVPAKILVLVAQPGQSEGTSTAVLEIWGAGERALNVIVAAFRCGTSKFNGKE